MTAHSEFVLKALVLARHAEEDARRLAVARETGAREGAERLGRESERSRRLLEEFLGTGTQEDQDAYHAAWRTARGMVSPR